MEIDKILFGQLSETKGIENPFEDLDVNNDGVINETDAADAAANQVIAEQITNLLNSVDEDAELVDADFDENEIPTVSQNTYSTTTSNPQAAIALTQLEINKLNDKQAEIQKDITEKQKELETKQKKIEEKQEELEVLVKEAQNNKDNSKAEQITDLQSEIKSLSTELEEIKSSIAKLESDYQTNSDTLISLKATLETQQTNAAETVSQVNAVSTVEALTDADEIGETASTTSTRKTEIKTMDEYKQILDCKFNELWERFGNEKEVVQYIRNNMMEFADITGDGKVDKIDYQILQNYQKMLPQYSINAPLVQERGREGWLALTNGVKTAMKEMGGLGLNIPTMDKSVNTYTLSDLENFKALGGSPQILLNSLDYSSVVKEENWESRLRSILPNSGILDNKIGGQLSLLDKLKAAEEFIKNNPENAGYSTLASQYQNLLQNYEKEKAMMDALPGYETNAATPGNWNGFVSGHFDINGDGKVDVLDYANFCTEIDLDGDGKISAEETQFLENAKAALQKQVYTSVELKAAHNMLSMDDMITYLENFDHCSFREQEKNISKNYWYELGNKGVEITKLNEDGDGEIVEAYGPDGKIHKYHAETYISHNFGGADGIGGMAILAGMLGCTGRTNNLYSYKVFEYGGLNDGTPGTMPHESGMMRYNYTKALDSDGIYNLWENAYDQFDPLNTYLHYVQSANLSKCELQSMLDKINSASSSVQSQLAEVKKVVETKLAKMI